MRLVNQTMIILGSILRVLIKVEVLYYLTYGALAFVALYVHPFFFCFHLTEIIMRYKRLRKLINTFWQPLFTLIL